MNYRLLGKVKFTDKSVVGSCVMAIYHRHKLGQQAEDDAHAFLVLQGMQLITKNFRACFGEVDLIMQIKILLYLWKSEAAVDLITARRKKV